MIPDGNGTKKGPAVRYAVYFGIVLLVTVILLLVPTKTISEEYTVSYEENETYDVPETYTERVTVSPTVSLFDLAAGSTAWDGGCNRGCTCDTYHYSGYTKICTYCICPAFPYIQTVTGDPAAEYQWVTKTRLVQNVRTVTKTRTGQRPVEVNWIFGFRTPYSFHLPVLVPF
jgi:hypothetical protein